MAMILRFITRGSWGETMPSAQTCNFISGMYDIILESGLSAHGTGNLKSLPHKKPKSLFLPDGKRLQQILLWRRSVMTNCFKVPNVNYVPGLSCNIILVSQLNRDYELSSTFYHDRCYVRDRSSNIVGFDQFYKGLFLLDYLRIEQVRTQWNAATKLATDPTFCSLVYVDIKIRMPICINIPELSTTHMYMYAESCKPSHR